MVTLDSNGNDDGIRCKSVSLCVDFLGEGDIDVIAIDGERLEGPRISVASEEDIGGFEPIRGHFSISFYDSKMPSRSALRFDATAQEEDAPGKLTTVGSVHVTRNRTVPPVFLECDVYISINAQQYWGHLPLLSGFSHAHIRCDCVC